MRILQRFYTPHKYGEFRLQVRYMGDYYMHQSDQNTLNPLLEIPQNCNTTLLDRPWFHDRFQAVGGNCETSIQMGEPIVLGLLW
jgi:hypothetical protein